MPTPDNARDLEQMWSRPVVLAATSFSVPTLYREMARGVFPRPVKVSRNRVAWRSSEVREWLRVRIAERDAGAAA